MTSMKELALIGTQQQQQQQMTDSDATVEPELLESRDTVTDSTDMGH